MLKCLNRLQLSCPYQGLLKSLGKISESLKAGLLLLQVFVTLLLHGSETVVAAFHSRISFLQR